MPKKQADENASAFKHWISKDLVQRLAEHIQFHHKSFNTKKFLQVIAELENLELKPRVKLVRQRLQEHLPASYPEALKILLLATMEPAPKVNPLKGFDLWPITDFVQTHGLDDLEISLGALREFTPKFTAEFAIRPFLIRHEKATLQKLQQWSKDKNHHVRRLVSEGSRPRLPWGEQLKSFVKDPTPTLKLLENLKHDSELYVRKSVANHLNDISKDHPEIALKILKEWLKSAPKDKKPDVDWIVRHALRTQIKAGNPKALALLGFDSKSSVKLTDLKINKKSISVGDSIQFNFKLLAAKDTPVMVDYIVHYQKAKGKTSPKVFKLTSKTLKKKTVQEFSKKHSFKPVTTRVLYPGKHSLEIIVNGQSKGKIDFILK